MLEKNLALSGRFAEEIPPCFLAAVRPTWRPQLLRGHDGRAQTPRIFPPVVRRRRTCHAEHACCGKPPAPFRERKPLCEPPMHWSALRFSFVSEPHFHIRSSGRRRNGAHME